MDLETYREIYKKVLDIKWDIQPVEYAIDWHWDFFDIKCDEYLTTNEMVKIEKIARKHGYVVAINPASGYIFLITFTKVDGGNGKTIQ